MKRIVVAGTLYFSLMFGIFGCKPKTIVSDPRLQITAADILGNPDYQAISYGGYRQNTRKVQPTMQQLKEDLRILDAMGVHVVRTYNTQDYEQAANIVKAISELNAEGKDFRMFVMLGAWISCKNAFTAQPDHQAENVAFNTAEINRAVELANAHPEVVKIIAVGNEAMVKWATAYYVQPDIILKWVNHLQELKKTGGLPENIWITSSDDFSSWGGGGSEYHVPALRELWEAVDYVSMHTYPMHYSHYEPDFWGIYEEEDTLSQTAQIERAMLRARDMAISKYDSVVGYMRSEGLLKQIHIGETGWASYDTHLYGEAGSRATDEYKQGLYHKLIREWTNQAGMSCFYFEAFDEPWKDAGNPDGSENHFGLINLKAQVKYALWDLVDQGIFEGLTRDGQPITKTYNGDLQTLLDDVLIPESRPKEDWLK